MNEELLQNEEVKEVDEAEYDVISEINKIKENTVSIDEYNKIKAQRDKYAKALVEGTQVDEKKQAVPIADLRAKLFGKNSDSLSNLDYVSTALELRNAILDTSGKDIFVGSGSKLTPDESDYRKAQRVADAFQQCIDNSEGDSEIFTRELMRITEDVKIPKKQRR